jgi:hypothetical protein
VVAVAVVVAMAVTAAVVAVVVAMAVTAASFAHHVCCGPIIRTSASRCSGSS